MLNVDFKLSWDSSELDADDVEMSWIYVMDDLGRFLMKWNHNGEFFATGTGLGWMKRSGTKSFQIDMDGEAEDIGEEFIRQLLPKTECTWNMKVVDNKLVIINSHHDAMNEVYEVELA